MASVRPTARARSIASSDGVGFAWRPEQLVVRQQRDGRGPEDPAGAVVRSRQPVRSPAQRRLPQHEPDARRRPGVGHSLAVEPKRRSEPGVASPTVTLAVPPPAPPYRPRGGRGRREAFRSRGAGEGLDQLQPGLEGLPRVEFVPLAGPCRHLENAVGDPQRRRLAVRDVEPAGQDDRVQERQPQRRGHRADAILGVDPVRIACRPRSWRGVCRSISWSTSGCVGRGAGNRRRIASRTSPLAGIDSASRTSPRIGSADRSSAPPSLLAALGAAVLAGDRPERLFGPEPDLRQGRRNAPPSMRWSTRWSPERPTRRPWRATWQLVLAWAPRRPRRPASRSAARPSSRGSRAAAARAGAGVQGLDRPPDRGAGEGRVGDQRHRRVDLAQVRRAQHYVGEKPQSAATSRSRRRGAAPRSPPEPPNRPGR
jgi:hypothetical protein